MRQGWEYNYMYIYITWGSRCFPNGMVCRALSVCIIVACGVLHCVHRMGTIVLWYVCMCRGASDYCKLSPLNEWIGSG